MKLNFPEVFQWLFFKIGLLLVVAAAKDTNAQEKGSLSHPRYSRGVGRSYALIPPLFPPHMRVRSSRSLHNIESEPPEEESSNRKSSTGKAIPKRFPQVNTKVRPIRSAEFIPPLFPPSEGRGKRSARFIPPLFPPSTGSLHRTRRSAADDSLIPPLFPPHSSRGRSVRSVNQAVDAALIPPLFPPSERKRRSKRASIEASVAFPLESVWRQKEYVNIGSNSLLSLLAKVKAQDRQRRSLDSAVIPPLFPPSEGIVRRRLPREADNPPREFRSSQSNHLRQEYEKGRLVSAAELSSKMSMWAVSVATASLAVVAFLAALGLAVFTRCHLSREQPTAMKLPV